MGGSSAGAGDRDVRQAGQIVERESLFVEVGAELAVGDAGGDGNGAGLGVECDDLVHGLQREKTAGAVDDIVKAVAGAENFQMGLLLDQIAGVIAGSGGKTTG